MSAISRRAARLAAVLLCAGVLAGCAAPASKSAAEPTPEPESSVTSTTLDANRREPFDPEYLTQLSVAAERAANYWQMVLDEESYRYLTAQAGMAGAVDPADDEDLAALLDSTDISSGTDYRAEIDSGEAFAVKVSFNVVYTPETDYIGPQYTDGTKSVYIFTPVDDAAECVPLSGWNSTQAGSAIPEISDEARTLQLNEWQHTMLVHQCQALAAAGITDFATPADWTDEQTAYYFAARGQDYSMTGANWPGSDEMPANMLLTIDFTEEDDWSSNARFFAADWPGLGDTAPDLPETPTYTWEYANDNGTITATGSVDGTPTVQYTFTIYDGTDLKWDARTVCTGGKTL